MDDIRKGKIFGDVSGFVYTIEFQKRGLPHAHLLLILHQSCKIKEPEDVDRIVCAEIPSPLTHPNLYEAVASHMMHGPCGGDFPNSPCMENSVCTKNFPKDLNPSTKIVHGVFPQYRRRDTKEFVVKRNTALDNLSVVPYNKYLLMKYNCHINVEVCASISCIKYIYKYTFVHIQRI